jgi:ATP-dependent Lon protease
MSELFNKVLRYFGEYTVDKRLAYELELTKLPRYVAEFLISEFKLRGGNWERELIEFVRSHYYEPEEKDLVKHKLVSEGTARLIDELRAYVDVETGAHIGVIHSLDIYAEVPPDIADKYKALLTTGMWGLITLTRIETEGRASVVVSDFIPFQAPNPDPKIVEEARPHFTLEEWVDVLVNTIGLDPAVYSFRQKLLLLTRLVPVVEGNVNLAEFGPRQTGKTYLYRHVSSYARIISGGTISPAALFYNLKTKVPGELAVKDVVVFDEVSRVRFPNPDEMMGKLKDYMESGMYERGDKKVVSDASLVFMGNVSVERQEKGYVPVEDLTYVLPEPMRDSAFIDRLHGLLPGWELPKISQSKVHLSKGYGIASDFFAEVLHQMRKESLAGLVGKHVSFSSNFTIRDEKSVKRVSSGLIKLLFPDKSFDRRELELVVDLALEHRQRVRDWLHKVAPGEFPREILSAEIRD